MATEHGVTAPRSKHAGHRESDGSRLGPTGGYLRMISIVGGFVIEFSRPQDGWSACSLRLHVKRPIAELLPQRDGLSESVSISLSHARQVAPA